MLITGVKLVFLSEGWLVTHYKTAVCCNLEAIIILSLYHSRSANLVELSLFTLAPELYTAYTQSSITREQSARKRDARKVLSATKDTQENGKVLRLHDAKLGA